MNDPRAVEFESLTLDDGRKNSRCDNGIAVNVHNGYGKAVFLVAETYFVYVALYSHFSVAFLSASALSVFSHGNAGLPK